MRTLVWFRGKELRLRDHAPLCEAAKSSSELVPIFVVDPYFFSSQRARELPHRIQFLLESVQALGAELARLGSRLILVHGRSVELIPYLSHAWRVDRVVAQGWTEPFARDRDRRIRAALDVPFDLFDGETLAPPAELLNSEKRPFRVFSAFANAFKARIDVLEPEPAPAKLPPLPTDWADRVREGVLGRLPTLAELGITPNPRILSGGEARAAQRLTTFLSAPGANYDALRNWMDLPGTSRLSQDLKFGLLSPRSVWTASGKALAEHPTALAAFQNELLWREFAHMLLWHDPELLNRPFHRWFEAFPWREDPALFQVWAEGRTGYPIVDAAARQLLTEGFVHNRARMIAASFLTKHLLVHYRAGEAHYLKYLTDGDWANNNLGWQWSAGCGADAQPYFRVFNPTLQGEKFDPQGDYVRRFVPELARMPASHIHQPWSAPRAVLEEAGVLIGRTYPQPIVEHVSARERFLALAESLKARL